MIAWILQLKTIIGSPNYNIRSPEYNKYDYPNITNDHLNMYVISLRLILIKVLGDHDGRIKMKRAVFMTAPAQNGQLPNPWPHIRICQ